MLLLEMLLFLCLWEQMQVRNYSNKFQLPIKRDNNSTKNVKIFVDEQQKPHAQFSTPNKKGQLFYANNVKKSIEDVK